MNWSGPVAGSVQFTYDQNYRVTQDNVKGSTITYAYDADDALTRAGSLTFAYNTSSGLLTGATLGEMSDGWQYNVFGERAAIQPATVPPRHCSTVQAMCATSWDALPRKPKR